MGIVAGVCVGVVVVYAVGVVVDDNLKRVNDNLNHVDDVDMQKHVVEIVMMIVVGVVHYIVVGQVHYMA